MARDGGDRECPQVTTTDHAIEFYISENALQAQYIRSLNLGGLGPTEVRGGVFYNEVAT
jgi:hypothetical protein